MFFDRVSIHAVRDECPKCGVSHVSRATSSPRGDTARRATREERATRSMISTTARAAAVTSGLAVTSVTSARRSTRTGRGDATRRDAGKRRGIGDILDDEFNSDGKKKERKSKGKRAGDGGAQFDRAASTSGADGERWIKVGNVSELEEKPIKALVLANGNFCMVKYGTMVFITACNSTAYQYPLIDGDLFEGPSGAAIRVPLDGTEYDLATGEVITWCPQNNMMRKFLGGLKKAATPVPLPVYPTKINDDGDVFTYFV